MAGHVLIVGINWPPETFLYRLINGLLEAGWEITVATTKRPESRPRLHWLPIPSADFHPLHRLSHFFVQSIRCRLRANTDVHRLGQQLPQRDWQTWNRLLPFAGRRWDLIYFPWNSAAIEYLPLFDLGMPVVLSCRGSQVNVAPYNPRRRDLVEGLRQTFARAAAVHCVSEDIKQEALQYGLDPAKAYVIRPAVDPNFFCPSPIPRQTNDVFRVVTTGSLIWRKGYEYALSAIRQLVDQGIPVQFEILGDGPERQRVLYTIHDLDLEQHVLVRGRVSPEQVRDVLQQADVFLLSSLSEGISNAVLEAMACGVPVVTTDCGGMREVVTDGVEGLIVPIRDPAPISQALLRLWHKPDLGQRMGSAGRQRILKGLTIQQQVGAFSTLFRIIGYNQV